MKQFLFKLLLLCALVFPSQSVASNLYSKGYANIIGTPTQFNLAVSMGLLEGFSTVDKFGVNAVISTDSFPEDIWEFGGEYNYDPVGTAPIMYISSSDPLDVGQTIFVQGLDILGNLASQTLTTDGNNIVNLGIPLWRVFRMINISEELVGGALQGVLYCHTDPTPTNGVPVDLAVRAIINDGTNQTLMTLYTVPKGFVAFLYRGEVGVELEGNQGALAEYAHVHYESRRFNGIFTVKKAITCMVGGGSSVYQDDRSFPDVIPSLTDIKLTVVEVSQTMGMFGTFDILLVEESMFSDSYLQSIGQPGY